MSTATTTRRRGPRLKVVSHSQTGKPRHRAIWTLAGRTYAIEFYSQAEWLAMHPAERHEASGFLPGVGHITCQEVSAEEANQIAEEHVDSILAWSDRVGCEA